MTENRAPTFRLDRRRCGVLLHPSSLPGPHGCGDLGRAAYEIADFLAAAGQGWWQMLPTGPPGAGDAPYSSYSAFAGSPLMVSLERLAEEGLLDREALAPHPEFDDDRVRFDLVWQYREERLRSAFERFRTRGDWRRALDEFAASHKAWLPDFALFAALRRKHRGASWTTWPKPLRAREPEALAAAQRDLADDIDYEKFVQLMFYRQWADLRRYCAERGVGLIGDVPIFVDLNSADAWANRELFLLDADGRQSAVAGVPPDALSADGQVWGNPLYDWPRHVETGFAWWIARFRSLLEQFDVVRIDHFLGFYRLYAIPANQGHGRNGTWIKTPGDELLGALGEAFGWLPIIAENLGVVTQQAEALRKRHNIPGMYVMRWGFGSDHPGARYHQPHNYERLSVGYPGTHDTETVAAWLDEARQHHQHNPHGGENGVTEWTRLLRYLPSDGHDVYWDVLRAIYASPANLVIVQAQDLLGLGADARMNVPGTPSGNWCWRLRAGLLNHELAERVRELAHTYERVPHPLEDEPIFVDAPL